MMRRTQHLPALALAVLASACASTKAPPPAGAPAPPPAADPATPEPATPEPATTPAPAPAPAPAGGGPEASVVPSAPPRADPFSEERVRELEQALDPLEAIPTSGPGAAGAAPHADPTRGAWPAGNRADGVVQLDAR